VLIVQLHGRAHRSSSTIAADSPRRSSLRWGHQAVTVRRTCLPTFGGPAYQHPHLRAQQRAQPRAHANGREATSRPPSVPPQLRGHAFALTPGPRLYGRQRGADLPVDYTISSTTPRQWASRSDELIGDLSATPSLTPTLAAPAIAPGRSLQEARPIFRRTCSTPQAQTCPPTSTTAATTVQGCILQ
jgi:hypothetical protein